MRSNQRTVALVEEGGDFPRGWTTNRVLERGRPKSLFELRPLTMRERIWLINYPYNIDRLGQRMARLSDGGPRWVKLP